MSARLPDGYVEIGRWSLDRLSRRAVAASLVLGCLAFVAATAAAFGVLRLTGEAPELRVGLGSLAAGAALGVVLHEASHAAAFLALGGRPRFGARARTRLGPVFHVSAPGCQFTRGAYLLAGLGATLVLAVLLLGVVAVAPAGGFVSAAAIIAVSLSVAGSAGDALIARAVLAYPRDARFEDTGEGFTVYGPSAAPR